MKASMIARRDRTPTRRAATGLAPMAYIERPKTV